MSTGTQDIRDALTCELKGTPASPSSNDLIARYRSDIASVASKLSTGLDAIGHSLSGDPGASRTPTYVSVPTTPSIEHHNPAVQVAAYNHGQTPEVTPQQLPEMPRASAPSSPELPSAPGTPSAPTAPMHSVSPTLANLVSGNAAPSGNTTASSGTGSSHGSASGTTPAGKAAQSPEHHAPEHSKPAGLSNIPSIPLPDLPAAATSIATAVTSATAHQLPTAPSTPGSSQAPASTGFTPGVSGTPPMTPAPPAGLAPVGGLTPTPVTQAPPVAQGIPATPSSAAPAPSPQAPAPAPRGPVADLGWIQRNYGLAPGIDLPKSENTVASALFITDLSESEAHLHRVLATLRHQFESAGLGQPIAVARITRGFEHRTVYVTSDGLSIHPHGVLLPTGVLPLDEMPGTPVTSELSGSLMVTDKLHSLIPRGWEVESLLSTVSGGESSQSAEQYQLLIESGELLVGKVSRGQDDVTDYEALSVFARAALGSAGCGELDVESSRLRSVRWIGTQPTGYLDVLARWYLADAAESMSLGRWGDAVWASERYMSIMDTEKQVA
ncbi:hypothetical protein [Mycobacteroides abscessus]|uniref:hypothetical protein n=1 Tax=Mycobacteroides abscessus TaxID=36809 RepID=UPI001F251DFF|nr:hypothetical protein [Mycobacteroides abscessus]